MKSKREDHNIGEEIITNGDVIVDDKEHKGHGCCSNKNGQVNMKKHLLHMVLCCGLPVLILFLVPFIARVNPGVAGILGLIAPFICPLIMGGMVFMMVKNTE